MDDPPDGDESHYGLAGSPTQVERVFPPEARRIGGFTGTAERYNRLYFADEEIQVMLGTHSVNQK